MYYSELKMTEELSKHVFKHNNRRDVRHRTAEGANHWVNSKDRNAPIRAVEKTVNHSRASCFIRSRMTSRPHRLKKTSRMQSKRCDLHHTWLHRETNEKLSFYCYSPRLITTTFSTKFGAGFTSRLSFFYSILAKVVYLRRKWIQNNPVSIRFLIQYMISCWPIGAITVSQWFDDQYHYMLLGH